MTFPELSNIEIKRKILGITQKQLAAEAKVSQSLIAKIESGKLKPGYILAKQIFETLNRIENEKPHTNEKTAKELMAKNIISCTTSQTIREASQKLINYGVSQLPVFENGNIVGTITERCIIEAQSKYGQKTFHNLVSKIMEPPLPIIDISTTRSALYSLMRHYQAVLVTEKGKPVGIIARADLMRE